MSCSLTSRLIYDVRIRRFEPPSRRDDIPPRRASILCGRLKTVQAESHMSTTGPNQKKSPYHLPGGLTVIISAAAAATAGPPRRDRQPARLPRPLVLSASSSLLRWHRQRSSLSSSTSTSTRVKRAVQGCPAGVPQTSWEPCRHHHDHGGLHGSTTSITARPFVFFFLLCSFVESRSSSRQRSAAQDDPGPWRDKVDCGFPFCGSRTELLWMMCSPV